MRVMINVDDDVVKKIDEFANQELRSRSQMSTILLKLGLMDMERRLDSLGVKKMDGILVSQECAVLQ